jgi:hypothetical protein
VGAGVGADTSEATGSEVLGEQADSASANIQPVITFIYDLQTGASTDAVMLSNPPIVVLEARRFYSRKGDVD